MILRRLAIDDKQKLNLTIIEKRNLTEGKQQFNRFSHENERKKRNSR